MAAGVAAPGTSTILITRASEELIFLKYVLARNEVFSLWKIRGEKSHAAAKKRLRFVRDLTVESQA
jgi:hypothetical protein